MKISFVVLHYKVSNITIECVENLLNQNYKDIKIIIVDNHSNNGSIEFIRNQYEDNEKIYIVSIEHNIGFAKANDLGYQIAKHKFNAECIIIINNDLMIEDKMFCDKVTSIILNNHYDIIGPDIINKVGNHQNPLNDCAIVKRDVDIRLMINRVKIILIPFLFWLKKTKSIVNTNEKHKSLKLTEGVPLHGSCLIFGQSFIKGHEYPFYPDTYLYGEEDILYYLSMKEKLRMVFDPSLKVKHMEDVSTSNVLPNEKKKRLFELKNSTQSLQVLKKLMTDN